MKPGYDARRRNRKVGTENQGFGQSNKMVVPWPNHRVFHEVLRSPVKIERDIYGQSVCFFVEPTTQGFLHPCTVDDVVRVLELVPTNDRWGIQAYVLRQPTRKQVMLRPTWGRYLYSSKLGAYSGATIHLEAQPRDLVFRWPRKQSVEDKSELERLIADGHEIEETKRHFIFHCNPDSLRRTMLYRTLLHEIGHHAHYRSAVDAEKEMMPEERLAKEDAYWSKPSQEKEAFAHQYAKQLAEKLHNDGSFPFDRKLIGASLGRDGLTKDWFV